MGFGGGSRSGWRRESMGTRSCSFTFYKVLMEFDGFATCCWGLVAAVAGGYTSFPMDLVAYVSMLAHIFSLEIWILLYPGHYGGLSLLLVPLVLHSDSRRCSGTNLSIKEEEKYLNFRVEESKFGYELLEEVEESLAQS